MTDTSDCSTIAVLAAEACPPLAVRCDWRRFVTCFEAKEQTVVLPWAGEVMVLRETLWG